MRFSRPRRDWNPKSTAVGILYKRETIHTYTHALCILEKTYSASCSPRRQRWTGILFVVAAASFHVQTVGWLICVLNCLDIPQTRGKERPNRINCEADFCVLHQSVQVYALLRGQNSARTQNEQSTTFALGLVGFAKYLQCSLYTGYNTHVYRNAAIIHSRVYGYPPGCASQ